jgi:hypothetical protein
MWLPSCRSTRRAGKSMVWMESLSLITRFSEWMIVPARIIHDPIHAQIVHGITLS